MARLTASLHVTPRTTALTGAEAASAGVGDLVGQTVLGWIAVAAVAASSLVAIQAIEAMPVAGSASAAVAGR